MSDQELRQMSDIPDPFLRRARRRAREGIVLAFLILMVVLSLVTYDFLNPRPASDELRSLFQIMAFVGAPALFVITVLFKDRLVPAHLTDHGVREETALIDSLLGRDSIIPYNRVLRGKWWTREEEPKVGAGILLSFRSTKERIR